MASSSGTRSALPMRGSPTGTSLTFLGSVMTDFDARVAAAHGLQQRLHLVRRGRRTGTRCRPAGALVIRTKPMFAACATDTASATPRVSSEHGGEHGERAAGRDTCRLHSGDRRPARGHAGEDARGAPSPSAPPSPRRAPPAGRGACCSSRASTRAARSAGRHVLGDRPFPGGADLAVEIRGKNLTIRTHRHHLQRAPSPGAPGRGRSAP